MIKRILCSILSFIIISSVLFVPSFSAESSEDGTIIYEEDFQDGVIDEEKIVFQYSNDNPNSNKNPDIKIENGKLTFERYDSVGCLALVRIYFNDNHTALTDGCYCVEYDLHKSNHRNVWMRLRNGSYEFSRDMYSYQDTFLGASLPYGKTYRIKYFADTTRGVYYVWVDGELLASETSTYHSAQKGIDSISLSLEGGNAGTCAVSIDNIKVYEAQYTDKMLVDRDFKTMTYESLLTSSPNILGESYIATDLNLYTQTNSGSMVSWTSSNEAVINPQTGKVTRSSQDENVTLTATISKGNESVSKTFEFTVVSYVGDALTASNDLELITLEKLSGSSDGEIVTSLGFVSQGAYGSKITYSSDSPSVVTESGRVVRPRSGEPDAEVNLTVTATYASESVSKIITFVVKAEEPIYDPQIMSDKDFFGVYDASSKTWTNKGVFDYSAQNETASMSEVEAFVMAGDYGSAKEELLTYMRERTPLVGASQKQNTIQAEAAAQNFVSKANLLGDAYVGGEWEYVEASVPTSALSVESPVSFDLVSFYNEASIAEIMTKESGEAPILRLTINGATRDFEATDDGYIRLGSYSDQNYGNEHKMYVKMFGEDLGDETYRSKIKFDLSSLGSLSGVTLAELVFKAKATLSNNEKKRILIIKSYSPLWDEESLVYKSHVYDYRSFDGQPNVIDWETFSNADVEYLYQICRFPRLGAMVCEYENTNDEKYAYGAIRQIMDFIQDRGGWTPEGKEDMPGQYPRSLDTSERLYELICAIDVLCESEHMSADSCTAIMKHIWHMAEASRLSHSTSGNWAQSTMINLYRTANAFPEFSASKGTNGNEINWSYYAYNFSMELMENNYYSDGTYIEPTGGYNVGSHKSYLGTYSTMTGMGYDISDEVYEKLRNGTYYNLLSYAPGGIAYAYGDSGYSVAGKARQFPSSDEIFNDPELQYIDSHGALGTKPSWTSKQFPVGKYTFMRSDWSDTALYMATQVRGYEKGSHGHADRNHVTVAAHGKLLLTDAGSFTYTSGALQDLGRSTKMHNTISVNDENQVYNESASAESIEEYGKINQWKTDNTHDFLVQSTTATPGFDHKRTILFVKPHYWIVSDYVNPEDDSIQNNIKQNWHMMPSAKMTVDSENNVMYSNNSDNINIVVASADKDASAMREEEGYWAQSIGSPVPNPYGYFEKSAKGDVTFDTALVPTKSDDASVSVERISLDTSTQNATSLKLKSFADGKESNGYYYLSYDDNGLQAASFDKFSTDGQMAFVKEDQNGSAQMMIMHGASYIKRDDSPILESANVLADISVSIKGSKMHIWSTEDIGLCDLKIYTTDEIKNVYVNGEKVKFSQTEGYITSLGTEDEVYTVVGDIFEPTQIIYSPDFYSLESDPTDGGRIVANYNAPTIASDGSLELKSTTKGQSVWRIYLNENKSVLPNGSDNIYCVDFDIKLPQTSTPAYVQVGDDGEKMYRAYINNSSHIPAETYTNIKFIVDARSAYSKKLIYLIDNDNPQIVDVGRNLQNFLLCVNASSLTYNIDNFAVYKISPNDFDGAVDFFGLTEASILGQNTSKDYITENLSLPQTLSWTSSDESIISTDGTFLGNMVWQSSKVTLVAKVGKKLSKAFDLTVCRKALPKKDGMNGDYLLYDDFETSTIDTGGIVPISGQTEIKNGKLCHTNSLSSGETAFNYYFTPQKDSQSAIDAGDILVVEFDVKKELDDLVPQSAYYIRIQSFDGWRHYAQTNVGAGSSAAVGKSGKALDDSDVHHFKYVLDTGEDTYSLYVDGMLEAYEVQKNSVSNPYSSIQALTIVNRTPKSTITLDNLKVYTTDNKAIKTGCSTYGITLEGELVNALDTAGEYTSNISFIQTGLSEAPKTEELPLCYVAIYEENKLKRVEAFDPSVVTYCRTEGIYGWWYPDAKVNVDDHEIGNVSVKSFAWSGVSPAGNHIELKKPNEK